jgi:anti-sigma-K factor RskA
MKHRWHEQIQRCLNGQASAAEAAALQAAMKEDADLRALYLDYMNLDVALGAAAEAAMIPENAMGERAAFARSPAPSSPRFWHWVAAAAATCAALVVFATVPRRRTPSQTPPDVIAACTSTEEAIARLSVEPSAPFPAWVSPTASILNQPRIPRGDF